MSITNFIKSYFTGSERTVKAKKNIAQMLIIKGFSIFITLYLVPLTLGYVDAETYGVWLAISSMVIWIGYFDIGINNGLKNNLAKAFANEDYSLGKRYVSTTYAFLIALFIPIMILLLIASPFINWWSLLNLSKSNTYNLLPVICVTISYFCLNFILSTINVVLTADQRPADASFRNLVQQIVTIIIIFILTKTTSGNLLFLCLALCASPFIVSVFFNFTLFTSRYQKISPSIKFVDFSLLPNLLKLGIQFFIIQIAMIVNMQMFNFLLIRYYGAASVTEYNIGYRYANVLFMVWTILISPLWVGVTDAITKSDYQWIKNSLLKYLRILSLFGCAAIIMLFLSSYVYNIWIGDKVSVSFSMTFWILMYVLSMMWNNPFVMTLNGAGILKIQTICCTISPIVFLITFFVLRYFNVGPYAVMIAGIICNFNGIIIAPIQCYYFLKQRLSSDSKVLWIEK